MGNCFTKQMAAAMAITLVLAGASSTSATAIESGTKTISTTAAESTSKNISSKKAAKKAKALAESFLATLTAEQLETVTYDFTKENAAHWSNLPANSQNRNGIALKDLSEKSKDAALALAKATLSEKGYQTLKTIMAADKFLTTDTGRTEWGDGLYYIAILGTPSETGKWMLQFSGHHLAENITFNGKMVSATPQFTGTEPQTFELGGITYEPLAERKNGMYQLIHSLSDTQLAEAEISQTFHDVVVGPNKDGDFPESEGILYTDLTKKQQKLVKNAIKAWVKDADEKTANTLLKAYLSDKALSQTYIGWSGSTDYNDVGSYVRIDGPRVWLEFIAQEGVAYRDQSHFHTVWRDKLADYGGEFTD
ncbi:DUF3500 domain-containing protein [Bacillus atrophaeus]|uniref:DUF3500 domain-containing protein n=1 Tax=Bacillus atrophaeus TaxID=1452 RepID=UPI002280AE8C|nr:DUF3500 domain-containing protein [Bacillus atrophaeus]MCY8512836.1 DUF3500 domain-containing protein [Bacillus atrophaeus]MCY8992578.1 DUF3500 domain-containing protein [Bacillus atrophaeus]